MIRRPIVLSTVIAVAVVVVSGAPASERDAWTRSGDFQTPSLLHRTWKTFTVDDGLPHERIRAIRIRGDEVWVGTEGGLALLEGERVRKSWTVDDGLPWPAISAIDFDPETRDVWLGTWGGGLARFSAGRFDRFDQLNSGLAGNLVFAVAVAGGRVWAATNGGLSSFDPIDGVWDLYGERRSDAPETAWIDLRHEDGHLNALAWCEGLRRFDLATKAWSRVEGRAAERVHESGVFRDGCATGPAPADSTIGLSTRTGQRDADSELPDAPVRCMASSGEEVWIGTTRGLARGRTGQSPGGAGPIESRDSPVGARTGGSAAPRESADDRERARPRSPAIGVLGPFTRPIALPGEGSRPVDRRRRADWVAAKLAAGTLHRGHEAPEAETVRVVMDVPEFTHHGWGTPEDEIIRLANHGDVLGVLGSFEPGSRIASAVILVSEVPVVNAASTAPTIDEILNPWIFRCPIDDPRKQGRFIDDVVESSPDARVAVLRTPGSLDRMYLDWWTARLRSAGRAPVTVLDLEPETGDFGPVLRQLERSEATHVLTWTDRDRSAAILLALREAGLDLVFVGSDRIVDDEFLERVGRDPGDVTAPSSSCSHRADLEARNLFVEQYREQSMEKAAAGPDAHLFFDATLHLAEAIVRSGPDRDAVRRTLRVRNAIGRATTARGRWVLVPLDEPPIPATTPLGKQP